MTRGLSGLDLAILRVVEDRPCDGMGHLAMVLNSRSDVVRARAERLRRAGLLVLEFPRIFPGRGHKIIIRKRGR